MAAYEATWAAGAEPQGSAQPSDDALLQVCILAGRFSWRYHALRHVSLAEAGGPSLCLRGVAGQRPAAGRCLAADMHAVFVKFGALQGGTK